jgi:hypothetical protein
MKIRADLALVSGVLLTIALLSLVRAGTWYLNDGAALANLETGWRFAAQRSRHLGVACLAITLVGLIVIWTGYVRRARAAWVLMAVITWAWAFPLFAWPQLKGPRVFTVPEWIFNAIYAHGDDRTVAQLVLSSLFMVIALLLPIRSFFFSRETSTSTRGLSRKSVSRFAVTVLLIAIAVFVWIHVQVYELSPQALRVGQEPPPPPPLPSHVSKAQ